MSTIFSKIIAGDIPSYKITEDDKFYAFLDINPMAKGHTLVVPKQETDYIFDLDDALLEDMIIFSKRVAAAIKKTISCNRVGVMVLGLEVPHAHIHLVPINKEGDMNLSNPKIKFTNEEFTEVAEMIKKEFQ
ncbi:MAG TPA: HIT family protein [Fermentimonas sp.]|nr:HIT family protein [Fermentimonas sp.]